MLNYPWRLCLIAAATLSCGGIAVDCAEGPCPPNFAPPGQEGLAGPEVVPAGVPPEGLIEAPTAGPTSAGEVAPSLCRDQVVLDLGFGSESLTRISHAIVTSQEQVDAWAGCEVLQGNVTIMDFPGLDLRPLARLREVTGTFSIRRDLTEDPVQPGPRLTSLSGLEALTSVGALDLLALDIGNLEALTRLQHIGEQDVGGPLYGRLNITGCNRLTSLEGLDNIEAYQSLTLSTNQALESVDNLQPMEELVAFNVSYNPQLDRMREIVPRRVTDFILQGSALTDLEDLIILSEVDTLEISENLYLEALRGLEQISKLGRLTIVANPNLMYITELDRIDTFEQLTVVANGQLVGVPGFPNVEALQGAASIRIENNGVLGRIDSFPKLVEVKNLCVQSNLSLSSLDLPNLQFVTSVLSVRGNTSLQPQWLEKLESVQAKGKFLTLGTQFENPNLNERSLGFCQP